MNIVCELNPKSHHLCTFESFLIICMPVLSRHCNRLNRSHDESGFSSFRDGFVFLIAWRSLFKNSSRTAMTSTKLIATRDDSYKTHRDRDDSYKTHRDSR